MTKKNSEIDEMFRDLFPIGRSLTGAGNVKTLEYLSKIIEGLVVKSVPSSEEIYDWKVPNEWEVNDAYVKNAFGKKIIDVNDNNLHLVGHSTSFSGLVSAEELRAHLFTLPNKPDWIPYRTSYYASSWGFCCKHSLLTSRDFVEPFEVCIDVNHKEDGCMVYAEAVKKGKCEKEIILSTYLCHPSMANDNLSGLILATLLFRDLMAKKTRFSYRLVIAPETIGALAFLKNHENHQRIIGGTIITNTAGPDRVSLKEAFDKSHWINSLAHKVIKDSYGKDYITYPFKPDGSDERQYSSPGFRIPTISFHKSKYYEFQEYHTSADNLDFVSADSLLETLNLYKQWIGAVDSYCFPKRTMPHGEYFLSARGLYPEIGGKINQSIDNSFEEGLASFVGKGRSLTEQHLEAFNWIMHLSDGNHSNLSISDKADLSLDVTNEALNIMASYGLVTL